MEAPRGRTPARTPWTNAAAWLAALVASSLPDLVVAGAAGSWALLAVKFSVVAAIFVLGFGVQVLKPLRPFALILLAFLGLNALVSELVAALGRVSLPWNDLAFVRQHLALQVSRFLAAVAMVAIARLVLGSFGATFLVPGQKSAPARPIPYVLTRPPSWDRLGWLVAGAMGLGLIVFVFVFGTPYAAGRWQGLLPLLPFVVLFAAANAFGEEVLYRAPWLGALEGPVGGVSAVLLTATVFGLAHHNGVPYGLVGMLMAFIPGWLMGKAMVETRGFFWAWFIHFTMDVLIFTSLALGAVTMGGR